MAVKVEYPKVKITKKELLEQYKVTEMTGLIMFEYTNHELYLVRDNHKRDSHLLTDKDFELI